MHILFLFRPGVVDSEPLHTQGFGLRVVLNRGLAGKLVQVNCADVY